MRWYVDRGGVVEVSCGFFPDPIPYHQGYNEVINGTRDGVFRQIARTLDDGFPADVPIYFRIAWEWNGNFPWNTENDVNFTINTEHGGQGQRRGRRPGA